MVSDELFQFPGIRFGRKLVARSRIEILKEQQLEGKTGIVHKYKLRFLTFSCRLQSSVYLSLSYLISIRHNLNEVERKT